MGKFSSKESLDEINDGVDIYSEDYIEKPIASKSSRIAFPSKIDNSLMNVIKKFGKKYGFINTDIISNWNDIVGMQFSSMIVPVKISFPFKERINGILYVRVKVQSVLAIAQYQFPTIIDRINTYFGYKAVERIKIHV